MRRIIINADDCGRNMVVNQSIRSYLEKGVLTSTTVMANMDDFEGAIVLYNDYSNRVSFGAHLNLTQGAPLTDPTIFLKYGFCKEEYSGIQLCGMKFRWKCCNKELRIAIYDELSAQISKIRSAGIQITHIDSHQHIHFAPCLTPVFAAVAKDNGITKIRRPKNFLHYNVHDFAIRGLNAYYMYQLKGISTTDYFSSARVYINCPKKRHGTFELMCHPGHDNEKYKEEMLIVQDYLNNANEQLITYNEL